MTHQLHSGKTMDITTIQNQPKSYQKSNDSSDTIKKQEYTMAIIVQQQPLIMNQKPDINKVGIYLCLKFLIIQFLSNLTSNNQFDKTRWINLQTKIHAKLKTLNEKYSFFSHILTFYKIIQNETISIFQLRIQFNIFFQKQGYSIYRIDKLFWKKVIQLTLQLKTSEKELYFQNQHEIPQKNNQFKIKMTEFQMQKRKTLDLQLQKQEQQKANISMDKQITQGTHFLEHFSEKHPKFNLKWQKNSFQKIKFKYAPTIKVLQHMQINFDTFNLIQQCQTYQCPFIVFLIPFGYHLAQILAYYEQNSRSTMSVQFLFFEVIKKINYIKNTKNPQLDPSQITDHITYLVNSSKYTPQRISQQQGKFLKCHSDRIQSFIPVYFHIFSFHAFEKYSFIDSLQNQPNIKIKRQKLKQRIQKMHADYKIYNNEDI